MNRAHATREAWHPQTKQDRELILRELDEVLASPHFCNSKRYPTLLKYIVDNTLSGKLEVLKERTLGVEVFDRPPTYDTNTDTVVRYTAGEVRKRLLLFYSERPQNSGIRISLPAGSYVAEFLLGHDASHDAQEDAAAADTHAVYLQEGEPPAHTSGIHEPPASLVVADFGTHPAHDPVPALPRATARSDSNRIAWAVVIVLLVCAIASGAWWKYRAANAQGVVDGFWAPVMRDQRTMIICTGSSVFAPQNYSGVETAGKDIDYTFVSMQIASAIAQVSGEVERAGAQTELASAATTALPVLREHSVTLLGGYNNQWTLRLTRPLRFHFIEGQGVDEIISDQQQPQSRWQRDNSLPYSSADDYALVARFRDPTIDGWVMVLAGLGRNGTEAAAQFATSTHYLQLLSDHVGFGFANRNIEAVIKVNVIDGKTGAPSIVAVHTW